MSSDCIEWWIGSRDRPANAKRDVEADFFDDEVGSFNETMSIEG